MAGDVGLMAWAFPRAFIVRSGAACECYTGVLPTWNFGRLLILLN